VALILDTGPLVAMLDSTDPDHDSCTELIQNAGEPRVVPVCVLVEIEYLMRPWPQAFAALLADFDTGALSLVELRVAWLARVGDLIHRYRDLPLGFVDATVLAAAEMLEEHKIATLDHRHFTVVRPAHTDALALLP
jgi:predicted nucleic acid-binding protein